MEHDGYESDTSRILSWIALPVKRPTITANWDYTVDAISWAPDSRFLYFLACRDGVKAHVLYRT